MTSKGTDAHRTQDKQLRGVSIQTVMEKQRLNQALNAKEFAICVGISYTKAREWFHRQGFPIFEGLVFWQDFLQWKAQQTGSTSAIQTQDFSLPNLQIPNLPLRAMQILRDV